MTEKYINLFDDLWWLRYKVPDKSQWYALTDYLRDKLTEDGFQINYIDETQSLMVVGKDKTIIIQK